jgi:preprotein translocase subunit SecF
VRSVNTSFVALLPVATILVVSIATLGSGDLKDLSLALLVGMAAGAYSSIFIATPLAVQLKSGEKAIAEGDARARARAKRDADRYADVPAFTDDMPLVDEDAALSGADPEEETSRAPVQAPPRRPEATGSGRVVPQTKRPSSESRSSGRIQPTRKPRSKRGR